MLSNTSTSVKSKISDIENLNALHEKLIIKRPAQNAHVNLIVDQEMQPNFSLNNDVMTLCEFQVPQTGYYHISAQLTIVNRSEDVVKSDYIQFGICQKDMADFSNLLKSQIISANMQSGYILADNIASIVKFDKNTKYNLWLNFGCVVESDLQLLEYQSEYSHLRLYKL